MCRMAESDREFLSSSSGLISALVLKKKDNIQKKMELRGTVCYCFHSSKQKISKKKKMRKPGLPERCYKKKTSNLSL